MNGPPPLPGNPRRGILTTCILGLILLPFFGAGTWYLAVRVSNTGAVHRLEARARAKGEPLTLAEVASKSPSIPDSENAAVALMQLWEKEDQPFWQAFRRGEQPMPKPAAREFPPELPFLGADARRSARAKPLPPASRAAAEVYLKEQAEHLDGVRLALRRPHCCFSPKLTKLTDGFAALLPYLSEMKKEAQSFRVADALAVERGDVDAAISALEDIRRTGQALTECPLLLDQLVRVACLTMALDEAQRLLSQQTLSAAQLDRLEALFRQSQTPGALRAALLTERAEMLSVFDLPAESFAQLGSGSPDESEPGQQRAYRVGWQFLAASGLTASDRRFMLETMEQAIALAGDDSPAALERYDRLFARVQKAALRFPPKIFSAMLLPSLERAGTKFAAFEARRRAALAALAVQRYRLNHQGRLPETLDTLAPEFLAQLPTDPFDGKPLRFHALTNGFVIYSIGRDRQDDGGKERPEKGALKDYDETFIVER